MINCVLLLVLSFYKLRIVKSDCRLEQYMKLKRKFYDKMIAWKKRSAGKSALLIEGARRVGKSTTAIRFAQEQYRSYILVDFATVSSSLKHSFENDLNDLDTFFQNLSLEYAVPLYQRESLIIFDEVQRFPKAREAIKYLVADGRYDYVEIGSLISIKENVKDIVLPSEEEKLSMFPLDFEEFLWAAGEQTLADYIRQCWQDRTSLEDRFHKRATRLIREYMLVGGMPQSVVSYFESGKDFAEADANKRRILGLYEDDIKKAAGKYRTRVSALFDSLPGFLSTHEKKVVLSKIDGSGTFDKYDSPFFWLGDSMICNLCYRCSDPHVGLALNRDNSAVKCYMGDTGLLVSHAFSENELATMNLYRDIIAGRLSLNEGMLHENLVAQMLVACGKKLYFYTHYNEQKHRNDIEIDFLVSNESKLSFKVMPVEVKSSKNYSAVSYGKFKGRFKERVGDSYIVHPKAFACDESGYKIPTYMLFCVFE